MDHLPHLLNPGIGQMLTTSPEDSNPEDKHSVAVQLLEQTVGHMPREQSRVSWYFLKHGGQIICEVTGRRKRSLTPGKGLEVPCQYTFKGKPALIKRLLKVLVVKK